MDFLGITRERVYSPGRVEDDAAILHQVADELRRLEHSVVVVDGDSESWPAPGRATTVFAMAQGPRALAWMQAQIAAGVRVVNHPDGILNCQRHRTVPRLQPADVGFPETILIDTTARTALPDWPEAWVKRGDVHATDAGDVRFVAGAAAISAALADLGRRGITRAAVQRHIEGDVIKFYGVAGSFFHCVPPASGAAQNLASGSRLGARGPAQPLPASEQGRIATVARRAASALSVEVFGGDCVRDGRGGLHIIDLNDWPSYRACRAQAASAIAAYLLHRRT